MDEIFNVLLWDLWHVGAFGEPVGGAERVNSVLNGCDWEIAPEEQLVYHTVLMTE